VRSSSGIDLHCRLFDGPQAGEEKLYPSGVLAVVMGTTFKRALLSLASRAD